MGFDFLQEHYPKRMEERYQLTEVSEDLVETFDHIGKLRRCYAGGGEIDYDQVAELIVRDVRNLHLR